MNLPNKLTTLRIGLTGLFLVAALWHHPERNPVNDTIALALFIVAGITDILDGRIARSRGLVTDFGKLMDPLADKLLICSAFIAMTARGNIEAWMVIIVVARELAITGLRALAASKNVVLAAEAHGKHKTVTQIVAICAMLVMDCHGEWGAWSQWFFNLELFGMPWGRGFTELAKGGAVLFTLFSGATYMWRNRGIYLKDM
jgi:CDP-diacylglycerol--glycerol-3-phosphate 3-phosphatidyltransferase